MLRSLASSHMPRHDRSGCLGELGGCAAQNHPFASRFSGKMVKAAET